VMKPVVIWEGDLFAGNTRVRVVLRDRDPDDPNKLSGELQSPQEPLVELRVVDALGETCWAPVDPGRSLFYVRSALEHAICAVMQERERAEDLVAALQKVKALASNRQTFVMMGPRGFAIAEQIVDEALAADANRKRGDSIALDQAPEREDRERIASTFAAIKAAIQAELDRGYVLSDEAGAGALWRRRWNEILAKLETEETRATRKRGEP
jgi:hypothetical protein